MPFVYEQFGVLPGMREAMEYGTQSTVEGFNDAQDIRPALVFLVPLMNDCVQAQFCSKLQLCLEEIDLSLSVIVLTPALRGRVEVIQPDFSYGCDFFPCG